MRQVRWGLAAAGFAVLGLVLGPHPSAQKLPPAEKSNMELVGSSDLQGRSAYQPVVHKHGNRFIAYIGHHGGTALNPITGQSESNGTSILDVTNPKQPKYLAHIPGEPGQAEQGGAQMVRVCDGRRSRARTKARSTCSAASATRRTKSGTSPIRQGRAA